MTMRGFISRIYALIAAYALVLHTMLAGMALAEQQPGHAPSTAAAICTGTPDEGQPADQDQQDHADCVLHCLFAGGTMDAGTPAVSGIIAIFAPADIRVSTLQPVEIPGRASVKNPQIPRAPPLA
jgi:hypothetical protein